MINRRSISSILSCLSIQPILSILFILSLLFHPTPVLAETVEPTLMPSDDEVNAIAKNLFCPVCENTPLDVCPTQACEQWRELIRLKLAEGWTEDQIKEYFVAQYGDRVLAEPPRSGLNWLFYLLVPVFFLIGVYIVARVLRSMRQPTVTSSEPAAPNVKADPYLAKMEDELRKRMKE